MPSTTQDTVGYIAPGDTVVEADVLAKPTYDGLEHYPVNIARTLLGAAAPGAAEISSAGSGDGALLPPGHYVLILFKQDQNSEWSIRSGRQGIFQLNADGSTLSALCNNYALPSSPLPASGSLTENQLLTLLKARLAQTG